MGEVESISEIVSGDGRDITLPPAPGVDECLVNVDKSNRDCDDTNGHRRKYISVRLEAHDSRLDKGAPQSQSSTSDFSAGKRQAMKNRDDVPSISGVIGVIVSIAIVLVPYLVRAQAPPPPDAPDVVDFSKLLPLLPEAPSGWTADKPEGSTSDVGGFTLTNVHRDYKKGGGDNVPTASISILDSAANPEYAAATTAAWSYNSETTEGYSKSVTLDGYPGFEAFESDRKHGTLWLMVAKRYFVQVELQGEDPKHLQDWIKRVDLKKLAEIK
jgi:hypothetical protein